MESALYRTAFYWSSRVKKLSSKMPILQQEKSRVEIRLVKVTGTEDTSDSHLPVYSPAIKCTNMYSEVPLKREPLGRSNCGLKGELVLLHVAAPNVFKVQMTADKTIKKISLLRPLFRSRIAYFSRGP